MPDKDEDFEDEDLLDDEIEDDSEPEEKDAHPAEDKDERLRDVVFRKLAESEKATEKRLADMQAGLMGQFAQMMGELRETVSTQKGGKESKDSGELQDLDDETIQKYIDAGRQAEVIRYLAKVEAQKESRASEEKLEAKFRNETRQRTTTRSLHRDFPELKSQTHEFTIATNQVYLEIADEEFGGLENMADQEKIQVAFRAAERVARLQPDLRDEAHEKERRKREAQDTQEQRNGSLNLGRPQKRKQKQDELPELTKLDERIADRWRINLKDDKVAKRIRQTKKELASQRYERRSLEDD